MVLVQVAKRVQVIPINEGQKVRIRIAVAVLSFLGSLGTAYLAGDFANTSVWEHVGNGIVNYIFSTGLYAGFLKR